MSHKCYILHVFVSRHLFKGIILLIFVSFLLFYLMFYKYNFRHEINFDTFTGARVPLFECTALECIIHSICVPQFSVSDIESHLFCPGNPCCEKHLVS